MSHNSAATRKAKSTRLENPSLTQAHRQQVKDYGVPKEKIPKMSNSRRTRTSKHQVPEPPKDIDQHMSQLCKHFEVAQASKNSIRVAGGGNAAVAPKYQSRVNLNNQPSKLVRPSVTSTSLLKPTPKEIKEFRETKDIAIVKEPRETRGLKEAKESREARDYREPKDYKEAREPRDPKELKESKDPKAKAAEKSPSHSHRSTRSSTNRTKNYFDKYLKFAFDLSTPEGVQKLEDHFFPNQSFGQSQNPSGNSNLKREE
ncbi:translation initiation factor IF-2 [Drosophila biarmipes]|uniref:translation initiation factor IF-2 n=1 Tax=Drosophila biarmipes TaxID=125945 RepID=UPI0007E5EA94|nr:translation initiation factor IF-2 [Drosophila biarmipes]